MWTHEFHQQLERDRRTMTLGEIVEKRNLNITKAALCARMNQYKKSGKCYSGRKAAIITREEMMGFVRDNVNQRDVHVQYGYSYNEIQVAMRSYGLRLERTPRNKRFDFSVVPGLIEQGKTAREIALIIGCGLTQAQSHYNQHMKAIKSDSLIADAPDEIKRIIQGAWLPKINVSNVWTLEKQ